MTLPGSAAHMAHMTQNHVQPTSAAAYASLTDLGERQLAVRQAIDALGTACNQAIADHLGVPVNQITGRVFELREKGLVEQSHKAVWKPTGRNVIWWRIPLAGTAPVTATAPAAA